VTPEGEQQREAACQAFSKVIRRRRLQANKTQQQVANACGMDRSYLSLLEMGKQQPSLSTFLRLAKGLEQRPEDLLHDTLAALEVAS
jgi:transcriptional regulator with XRE-family HTH domain